MENILSGQSFEGVMDPEEKEIRRKNAERFYGLFLDALGYAYKNDPNMAETPHRVVKVYLDEICKGTYMKEPKITSFENQQNYEGIVFSGPIDVKSVCSHHMLPFFGEAYIAYIPKKGGKIVGLSKLSRVVKWYANRPQLQEQLTRQIHNYLNNILEDNLGVAVLVKAKHTCVALRGVEDMNSFMQTSKLSGVFLDNSNKSREEFYTMISNSKN